MAATAKPGRRSQGVAPAGVRLAKVIDLAERRNAPTRDALVRLASMAARGEVVGVAVCYLTSDGTAFVLRTGAYRRPGMTARAGFLLQMEDLTGDEGQ